MKKFEELNLLVITFSYEDVITTSGVFTVNGTYSEEPLFGSLDSLGKDLLN